MNRDDPHPAVAYRFRIEGHLAQRWSHRFGDLVLILEDDGTTSLTGAVADQAELHGVLAKIRDLGVALISVQLLERAGVATPPRPPSAAEASR